MTIASHSSLSGPELLLACYQQLLGHDLPNKLVALQGLARLVVAEAGATLTGDARDGLDRIALLARQLHLGVQAASELGRCQRLGGALTDVAIGDVWEEVQAEVLQRNPRRVIHWNATGSLPTLPLPRQAFTRVVLELALASVQRCPAERALTLTLTMDAGRLMLADDGPALPAAAQLFDPPSDLLAAGWDGLRLLLARLLAETWGGKLDLADGPGCRIIIELPREACAGRDAKER